MKFKIQSYGNSEGTLKNIIEKGGSCVQSFSGQERDIPLESLSPFLRKQIAKNVRAPQNDGQCPSLSISEYDNPNVDTDLIVAVICELAWNGIREIDPECKFQFKGDGSTFFKHFNRISLENGIWESREGWSASQVGAQSKSEAKLNAILTLPLTMAILMTGVLGSYGLGMGLEWVPYMAIGFFGLTVLAMSIQLARRSEELRRWDKVLDNYLENIDGLKKEYFDFILDEGEKVGADRESLRKELYTRVKFPYENAERKDRTPNDFKGELNRLVRSGFKDASILNHTTN